MPTVIKAHTAADLLAFVPHLVGYTPRRSVILMMFEGKRTCGALRMDLPEVDSPPVLKHFARVALGTVAQVPGVDAIVPVVFTDERFGDDSLVPHGELVDVLRRRCRHAGLPVREALCLAADGWASYLDSWTPRGGRPLDEVTQSDVVERVPVEHRAGAGDHLADASFVPVDPGVAPSVSETVVDLRNRMNLADVFDDLEPDLIALMDVPAFIETALSWTDAEVRERAALLLFALQGPPMRDQTMLQWATSFATGKHLHAEIEDAGGDPLSIDPVLGDIMLGVGPRPDPDRIARGIAILRVLLESAEDQLRPPVLCMLTWLNWALGKASHASLYVQQALDIDPDYSMAELLEEILASGRHPDWAFERP